MFSRKALYLLLTVSIFSNACFAAASPRPGDLNATDFFSYLGVPTDSVKANLPTSVGDAIKMITPTDYKLEQNYPNPFNPVTNIRFNLKETCHVTLKIYNELGQEVTTLLDRTETAGFKGVTWNASNMPSGIYFYKLTAGDYTETKKMVLSK